MPAAEVSTIMNSSPIVAFARLFFTDFFLLSLLSLAGLSW